MLQEFVQEIKDTISECLGDVHTALPAEIVSVDRSAGMATVLPSMQMLMPNGQKIDYPKISGVPIVLPQGAGQDVSISYPVKAGDGCLLIISEQSLEYWLYERQTDTTLKFDITNAICIPGLFRAPPASFSTACSGNAVIIDAGDTRFAVRPSGVSISGSVTVTGSLSVSGGISAGGSISSGNGNVI